MTSITTHNSRSGQVGAAVVVLAPAALLAAFLIHPFFTVLPDSEAVAAAVEAGPTRWAVAHVLTAVASGLMALAFLAIRAFLHDAGEDRFSRWGLPFIVFGSVMYAVLPGLEFAPLAAAETGGDTVAAQAVLEPWFVPTLATAVITYAIGVYGFARGIADSAVLNRGAKRTVVTALAIMAVARAVPIGVVQFYVQGLAGLVALWPLGVVTWRSSKEIASVRRPSTEV